MNKDLGVYLKKIRTSKKLTLRQVEEKTGISNAYLSQLENSKILNPSPRILYKLSDTYNVNYSYLMELVGYPSKSLKDKKFRISSEFTNLSNIEKEKLIEYLHFLRSRKEK